MDRRQAPPPQSLGPTDLSAAAAAFEAGLDLAGGAPEGSDPRTLREDLARHVIEQALRGERDAAALRSAAFRFVEFNRARRR